MGVQHLLCLMDNNTHFRQHTVTICFWAWCINFLTYLLTYWYQLRYKRHIPSHKMTTFIWEHDRIRILYMIIYIMD